LPGFECLQRIPGFRHGGKGLLFSGLCRIERLPGFGFNLCNGASVQQQATVFSQRFERKRLRGHLLPQGFHLRLMLFNPQRLLRLLRHQNGQLLGPLPTFVLPCRP
jgi:hypothetical protein